MLLTGQVIPHEGDVDGCTHTDRMQGLDLLSHQVKFQMWMHRPDLGGIVGEAVMAFGENGHRVHVPHLHCFRKDLRVKVRTDILTCCRGMKIQVDLAKS